MNQKKAKACRALAKEYAQRVGLPALDYQVKTVYKDKLVTLPDGRSELRSIPSHTIFLGKCERKEYKDIKKANK